MALMTRQRLPALLQAFLPDGFVVLESKEPAPLRPDTPGTLSGEAVRAAFQDILDGADQFFLLRRADTGALTVFVSGKVVVEFDLSTPPN